MKLTYEYKEFADKKHIMFRIEKKIFILKNFLLINKENIEVNKEMFSDVLSLVYIENIKEVLILPDAIILTRNEIKSDLGIIETIVSAFIENISTVYNTLDLTLQEKLLHSNNNINNYAFFIQQSINKMLQEKFHDIFYKHGGYAAITSIDTNSKKIYFKLFGNCLGCKHKKNIFISIKEYLHEINVEYDLVYNS